MDERRTVAKESRTVTVCERRMTMEMPCAQNKPTREGRELFSRRFFVGYEQACCRLLLVEGEPPLFFIELTLGEECASAPVGSRLSRAARLFDLLVDGTVTPCTLHDVLEDQGVLLPME